MFFRFPPDARWNPDRNTVEFGVGVGEYEGLVRVSGACSKFCFRKRRYPKGASKAITFTGLGSNSSQSGKFAGSS
jgi:hypothetical protein